jgi:DNA modification methylase/SAM-dependent methyltransferase
MKSFKSNNNNLKFQNSWNNFAKKQGLSDIESIFATTILAAVILASKNINKHFEDILHKWLEGDNSNYIWESVKNSLPISPFLRGKKRFVTLPHTLRMDLFEFLSSRINDPAYLFGELRLAILDEEETKKKGMIFTPLLLAEYVTRNAFLHWKRLHRKGNLPKIIGDVSCGTGAFLLPIKKFFGDSAQIVGIDADQLSVSIVKILSAATGNSWDIQCYDSLLKEREKKDLFIDKKTKQYDLLIGNPPYVRSQLLDPQYKKELKEEFADIIKGNFDLSILFIEHALRNLSPGGIVSYILSNKFMTSSYGRSICHKLSKKARIINLTDFFDSQLFPGRTTYTCILTLTNLIPAKRFTMSRILNVSEDSRVLNPSKSFTLPIQRLNEHPWDFATGAEHKILKKQRDRKHPLLIDVFEGILQGVRTGANNIFVLGKKDSNLEKALLHKFVSGAEIRACRIDSNKKVLIFPYRENSYGVIEPYTEDELQTKYIKTWAYLSSKREMLEQRDLDTRSPWYAFSRNQNLDIVNKKKLLVREMMPCAEFASDFKGNIVFCSGYALIADHMSEDDLRLWTTVLCTPTMEFLLRNNGTQLHSGWFRLLKHHLRITRLPMIEKDSMNKANQIALKIHQNPNDKKLWIELDRIVASAFELTTDEHQYIKKFINECHHRSGGKDGKKNNLASLSEKANITIEVNKNLAKKNRFMPVKLSRYEKLHCERFDLRRMVTFELNKSIPIHNWYSFTQGFSEPLIFEIIKAIDIPAKAKILDPFVGSGTTLVACLKEGIKCTGIEISPLMAWVTKIKTRRWDHKDLLSSLDIIKKAKIVAYRNDDLPFIDYLKKAFAESILYQLCGIIQWIKNSKLPEEHKDFFKLGVISIMEEVSQIRKHGSHYRYLLKSENIGLQKLNIQIINPETDIQPILYKRLEDMIQDTSRTSFKKKATCEVICGDAKHTKLAAASFDAVITSPPYLNRNCYIAQQKAEMALLGFVSDYQDYKNLVLSTFRSHVESKLEEEPVTTIPEVQKILNNIILLPNNNKKIPHMIAGYFEDLKDSLQELARLLKPNSLMAFVVGNSRWGGVVVPVDHILAMLAEQSGFKPEKILVTRLKGNSPQQMRLYGRIPVRESIVILKKVADN